MKCVVSPTAPIYHRAEMYRMGIYSKDSLYTLQTNSQPQNILVLSNRFIPPARIGKFISFQFCNINIFSIWYHENNYLSVLHKSIHLKFAPKCQWVKAWVSSYPISIYIYILTVQYLVALCLDHMHVVYILPWWNTSYSLQFKIIYTHRIPRMNCFYTNVNRITECVHDVYLKYEY